MYSNFAVSGGDIATIVFNVIFGLLHICIVTTLYFFLKKKVLKTVVFILICQLVELLFFLNFGSAINSWYKSFMY